MKKNPQNEENLKEKEQAQEQSKNKNENVEANIINDGIIRTILYFLSAFPILLEFNL